MGTRNPYSVQIGVFRKSTFSISPTGISWRNQSFPLEAVTRVWWGGERQSLGARYMVAFGNDRSGATIELTNQKVFAEIIMKLMLAVGLRSTLEMLQSLKEGKELQFGDVIVMNDGVILPNRKHGGPERAQNLAGTTSPYGPKTARSSLGPHKTKSFAPDCLTCTAQTSTFWSAQYAWVSRKESVFSVMP
jgi:hypothetical protein